MNESLLLKLIVFAVLFSVGWFVGRGVERRHLQALSIREQRYANIAIDSKRLGQHVNSGQLICSNVVISHDYFKYVLAQIYSFFGGRIVSYESLMQRAQREAIVRLKQQAQEMGAIYISGLRIETTSLSDQGGMVEVMAYATAIYAKPNASFG